MKRLSRDHVIYYLSPHDSPAATMDSGEEIQVELHDTYTSQIQTPHDLRSAIDLSKLTPLTGPIEIAGAQPGDSLHITVKEITLASQGVMVISPGLGVLGEHVTREDTKIIPIQDGHAVFGQALHLPVRPMIGTIGVAPVGDSIRAYIPGDFGGNMDIKDIGPGAQVYLPVFVPGALLSLGDLHALQGDGELDGTGIEIAGSVTLGVELAKGKKISRPQVVTDSEWMVVASARSLDKAIEIAVADMVNYLSTSLTLPFADAYRLVSAVGDIRIGQVVNPRVTVRVAVPRQLMDGVLIS